MLLMTPEGKKVKLSPRDDTRLYRAPHNPPNTGTAYTRGADLYLHRARSGKLYYYLYHWSMWQGDSNFCELLTEDQAKNYALEKATSPSEWEREGVEDAVTDLWGGDFLEEDA